VFSLGNDLSFVQNMQNNTEQCDPHIGAYLRGVREKKQLELESISQVLKIQPQYLTAIEKLDATALPSLGYVLGFVRSYAMHLGLNADDAVKRYKVDIECPRNMGMRDCPHFVPKRTIHLPKGTLAVTAVFSCVLVLVSWYGMNSEARSEALVSQLSKPIQNWDFAAPQPTQGDADVMSLKAVSASWVEVKDARGTVLISRILLPGEIFEFKKQSQPRLSIRDAGAVEIYIAGENRGLIGAKGQSARDISLVDTFLTQSTALPSNLH
jgi:hypothetical protein